MLPPGLGPSPYTFVTKRNYSPLSYDVFDQRRNVNEPAIFLDDDTRVRLTTYNSNSSVTQVFVRYKLILENGDILDGNFVQTPNTDRSAKVTTIQIGTGWLIYISIDTGTVSNVRGRTFGVIQLFNAKLNVVSASIVSHYVDNSNSASWPYGKQESPTDGNGFIRAFTGTDPAAGAQISETVPTGARWKLKGLTYTLVTDANAGTRQPELVINNGTNDIYRRGVLTGVGVSATGVYFWAIYNYTSSSGNNVIIMDMGAELVLFAGFIIKTITPLFFAGDNFGAPILYIEEWLEP